MSPQRNPHHRIVAVDAIRGLAVCGILAMNVVGMSMPAYAYVDPRFFGGADGADLAAWAVAYVLFDGKMRALFSMLFGASLLITTDAAEDRKPGPPRTHYARIGWLLVFGMLHAWLVWYGDILVQYATCGAIAYIARRWPPAALGYAAALLIGWDLLHGLVQWVDLSTLSALSAAPDAPADAVTRWSEVLKVTTPQPDAIAMELQLYRGTFGEVFAARRPMTMLYQTTILWTSLPETLGFVTLGMLLYRVRFWQGEWRAWHYRTLVAAGLVVVALYLPLARSFVEHRFDPAFLPLADTVSLLLRPWLALGYASGLILLTASGRLSRLIDRLAAAGRTTLSNYLGTSVIVTTLFYGYGGGLFGMLSRAQLGWIVLGQWLLILTWSKLWLTRFRYGPLEWLWRTLARGTAVVGVASRRDTVANGSHYR